CEICDMSRGLTVIESGRRDPKSIWNCPSGTTTNSSCDCPRNDPRLDDTPTTRKWCPSTWITLSIGSVDVPNNVSAVCQPMTQTGLDVSTSIALINRPR